MVVERPALAVSRPAEVILPAPVVVMFPGDVTPPVAVMRPKW